MDDAWEGFVGLFDRLENLDRRVLRRETTAWTRKGWRTTAVALGVLSTYNAFQQWERMTQASQFSVLHRVAMACALLAIVGWVVLFWIGPRRDAPDTVVSAAGLDTRTWWVGVTTIVLMAVPILSLVAALRETT